MNNILKENVWRVFRKQCPFLYLYLLNEGKFPDKIWKQLCDDPESQNSITNAVIFLIEESSFNKELYMTIKFSEKYYGKDSIPLRLKEKIDKERIEDTKIENSRIYLNLLNLQKEPFEIMINNLEKYSSIETFFLVKELTKYFSKEKRTIFIELAQKNQHIMSKLKPMESTPNEQ